MKLIFMFILMIGGSKLFAQLSKLENYQVDSLKNVIKNAKHDTTKANCYIFWDNIIYVSNPKLDSILVCEIESICYHNLRKKLNKKESDSFKKSLAFAWMGKGIIFSSNGDYAKAMNYYTKSLRVYVSFGDKSKEAGSLINIANIYSEQGDSKKAIEFLTKSLNLLVKMNDKNSISNCLVNLGTAYMQKQDFENSIKYYKQCITISNEIGNKRAEAFSLINIGEIYVIKNQTKKALNYCTRGLLISEDIGDDRGISFALNQIGAVHKLEGNYVLAIENCRRALNLSRKIGVITEAVDAAQNLYECYKANKNHELALNMHELFIQLRDSLGSDDNHKEIIRQQYKYDYEKKTLADSIRQSDEKKVNNAIIKQVQTKQYALILVLFLTFVFGIFMFNRLRITRKQKSIIEHQKLVVEEQKLMVDSKQKAVMDSIHYAKRIQDAILPNSKVVQRTLNRLKNKS